MADASPNPNPRPILHVVTDRRRFGLSEAGLLERIGWLAVEGVDAIQIRERDLDDRRLAALVRGAMAAAAATPTRILLNDRTDIALACGAGGVHLREDSVSAGRVRALGLPATTLVGRSVHTLDAATAACETGGCDYLLFGTVFASGGKPPGHLVAGVAQLAEVCAVSAIPVLAIGGITPDRAAAVAAAGAAGMAVVEALLSAGSREIVRQRISDLRQSFNRVS